MAVLELDGGRRVQLWDGGDPDGTPVLVLHGCPDTRHVAMTGAAAARRTGVRLVAVNRPGYGASDPHPSTQTTVADDLVAVADRLGIGSFALLGMSLGGTYAVVAAARHPERVTALGLVAAPDPRPAPSRGAGTVEATIAAFGPEFAAWRDRVDPADPDDDALTARWLGFLPSADADLVRGLGATAVAASVREALARPDGYLRDAGLTFAPWEASPGEVRCPALLWYGDLDENAPVSGGRALAAALPSSRLTVRPGTTHLATLVAHWDEIITDLADASLGSP